jgi:enamine deaminase RidA (YjgF/YER057c/UK114 family)
MMAQKQIIDVPGLFDSRRFGYEQCIVVGDVVYVAGQGGVDEQGQLVSPEFEAQARRALHNVRLALEAAGASPADVTAATVYLTDIANLRTYSAARADVLPEMHTTGTAVEVSRLALPGMLFEVTVTAHRPTA